MTDQLLAIRFDIDTIRCVREGLPALLELAQAEGCKFTFFVNMGRSITRRPGRHKRKSASVPASKLPTLQKLGLFDLLETLLLNPRLGVRGRSQLLAAHRAGHELGLHGGHNHGTWYHQALKWDRHSLCQEVAAGVEMMAAAGLGRPLGFASPGFTHPGVLDEVLLECGFRYVADGHDPDAEVVSSSVANLIEVNTNVLGMPGIIGYIEWCVARGLQPESMGAELEKHLRGHRDAILYDHPLVAGLCGLGHVREVIRSARAQGFKLVTIAEMLEARHP